MHCELCNLECMDHVIWNVFSNLKIHFVIEWEHVSKFCSKKYKAGHFRLFQHLMEVQEKIVEVESVTVLTFDPFSSSTHSYQRQL